MPARWPVLDYPDKLGTDAILAHRPPGALTHLHGPHDAPMRLIRADNLDALAALSSEADVAGHVDCVYIDPPYATGRRFAASTAEHAYADVDDGAAYVEQLRRRLVWLVRLLGPDGSIYVHVDPRAAAYLRVVLDELLGPRAFRNELIVKRTATTKAQSRAWSKMHDVILYYTKSARAYFDPQRTTRAPEVEATYRLQDGRGKYKLENFSGAGAGPARYFGPERGWIRPPSGKHWIWGQERIDEALRADPPRLAFSRLGNPKAKRYLHEVQAPPLGSVWTDLVLGAGAHERVDYPTQKPLALLERVLMASCPPDGLVLDCYAGSGTTLLAAARSGRRAIGVDAGDLAATRIAERAHTAGVALRIDGFAHAQEGPA